MSKKAKNSGFGLVFLLLFLPALGWGQTSCDLNRADMDCSGGFLDASDLVALLNVVYNASVPFCDNPSIKGDLNCDGFRSSADVALILDVVFLGSCVPCGPPGPTAPDPADSIIIESKLVLPGAAAGAPADTGTYLRVRVFITNRDSLRNVTLPLEIRSASGGAFIIPGWPRNPGGLTSRLTSTLGPLIASRINSVSPDSATWVGFSSLGDDATVEPPNAVRKALWDLKFDTVEAACGLVYLDSIRILDNSVSFVKTDATTLPVNFVRGVLTVGSPSPSYNLRTKIQHFGPATKGKWRWVRILCQNVGGSCPIVPTLTWQAPPEAEAIFAYPRAYPFGGGASVPASVTPLSATSLFWNLPGVNNGDGYYLWARYKIPCGLANATPLAHSARSTPVVDDLDTLNNTARVTVLAVPGPGCPEPGSLLSAFETGDEAEKFTGTTSSYVQAIDTLTYLITFRNNGGGNNTVVTVRDTLDTELNLATFDSLGASHNYTFAVNGREVSWTFSGINLPDSLTDEAGSLGFAAFRILLENGVTEEDTVRNQAEVYFDLNPPLPTTGQPFLYPCSAAPGDMDDNIFLEATDVVLLMNCVFLGDGDCRNCFSDLDCDRELTPTDVIMLMNTVFLGDPLSCP